MKTLLTLLLIALLTGCARSVKERAGQESHSKPKIINSLELVLKTDKGVYQPRELITLELIVTNKGNEAFKETFRSALTHNFVAKKDSFEIWRWAHDRMFAMMLTDFALEPEESVTYKETWNQKGNDGNFVPPGKYNLVGILKARPERRSFPFVIEIKD